MLRIGIEFDDDDDKSLYDYKFSRWLIKEKVWLIKLLLTIANLYS